MGCIFKWIWIVIVLKNYVAADALVNCTNNRKSVSMLLNRDKRYLFFPAGSAVLATMFVSKALASKSPIGVFVLTEFDLFYPLPIKVSDWQIKKPPPVPLHSRNLTSETSNDIYGDRPGEIRVPSLSNATQTNNYINYKYEKNAYNWKKKYQSKWQPYYKYQNNSYQPFYYQRNQNSWQTPMKKMYTSYWNKRKTVNFNHYTQKRSFDIEEHRDWKHYHGHKHRRDIYAQIESIAKLNGFDIKSCMLRLICEVRHYLLPPGISFFQDVLRILFAIPLKETMDDEYSNAMRADKESCQNIYKSQCPYSILGYLLHHTRKDFIY